MGYKCFICGHPLIWGSDIMQSDLDGSDLTDDENSVVSIYSCPYCGASYSITIPSPSEQKNIPYYQNNNNNINL